jgi:hypothetical protein
VLCEPLSVGCVPPHEQVRVLGVGDDRAGGSSGSGRRCRTAQPQGLATQSSGVRPAEGHRGAGSSMDESHLVLTNGQRMARRSRHQPAGPAPHILREKWLLLAKADELTDSP